ncbi:MAG: septum formation initiator family protein [Rikenellaceae bacterium]
MKNQSKDKSNPFNGLERAFNFVKDRLLSLGAIVVMIFMVVVIGRNAMHAISINMQIQDLMKLRAEYQDNITRDSTIIERLKYDEELERYARENYYMQHPNEEVFIIE